MPESNPVNPAEPSLDVRTYFVRNRNVLLARADFSDLFVDYYLHLADHKITVAPGHDVMFKRALAAFTLHCASQPRNVMTAWTMNFQQPLVNLFLTGDNEFGSVTGRVFAEDVKVLPEAIFYADVVRGRQPSRRSMVNVTGSDPLAAVETFYTQSEQRAARYFQTGEESFAMLTEHPDCDMEWLQGLTPGKMAQIDHDETLVLLETRVQRWHCGCNQERMLQVLLPVMQQDPDGLFGDDPKIEIRCPRCEARHAVTSEALEAYAATHS